MNIEDIRTYCLQMPDVEEALPFGPETLVFKTGGKIFLLLSLDSQPLQFNAKCDPERAIELRDQHACIIPGYHMNKKHWNTVIIDNSLPTRQLKELMDHSYSLVAKPKKKLTKKLLLILSLLAITGKVTAQEIIPFDFTSEEENRQIKENDSLKYFVATSDTSKLVVLNEENLWYKLLNKDRKVIAEGAYLMDNEKYLQDGKWVEKYDNGKVKNTGCYRRNLPIGTWQEYYNTGKPKSVSNYGIITYKGEPLYCLAGTWQEFYPDGKLKVSGFYGSTVFSYKDTVMIEDPISGKKVPTAISHNSVRAEKTGHWEYYSEAGELDKKEDL
jgi:predicted DNA-binding protein (MmcQ/YjbR family)